MLNPRLGKTAKAINHHRKYRLRKFIQGWRVQTRLMGMRALNELWQKRIVDQYDEISAKTDQTISQLKEKLELVTAEKDYLERQHRVLAHEMRQSFMRGVCALNMEALSMFNENEQELVNAPPRSGRRQREYRKRAQVPAGVCAPKHRNAFRRQSGVATT